MSKFTGTNIDVTTSINNVPQYMKNLTQWIVWGKRDRKGVVRLDKDGKLSKLPYNPTNGRSAKSNDSSTWSTFQDVVNAYNMGMYNGIGFVFHPQDNLVCIDLDDCFDNDGNPTSETQEIIGQFSNTFIEYSPSKNGLHIICQGVALATGKGTKNKWIEVYGGKIDGKHSARYFCLTGLGYPNDNSQVTNCQAHLAWLHNTFKKTEEKPKTKPVPRIQSDGNNKGLQAYVNKAIDSEVANVAGATEGDRNDTLKVAAPKLFQLVRSEWAAPYCSESQIADLLRSASGLEQIAITKLLDWAGKTDIANSPRPQPESKDWQPNQLIKVKKSPKSISAWLGHFEVITNDLSGSSEKFWGWVFGRFTNGLALNGNFTETNFIDAIKASPLGQANSAQVDQFLQNEWNQHKQAGQIKQHTSTNKGDNINADWEKKLTQKPIKEQGVVVGYAIENSLRNLKTILENHEDWKGKIRHSDFSLQIEKHGKLPIFGTNGAIEDNDLTEIQCWFDERYGLKPKQEETHKTVISVAKRSSFHPVRDYLSSLKWDGVQRVKGTADGLRLGWLSRYAGAQSTPATKIFEKCFLVGAVARIMEPGCKVDTVLILVGKQGIGKSTSLKVLFSPTWFTDASFDLGSKDGFMIMRGKWCVELAELDKMKRAEESKAKTFFGQQIDEYRPPYGVYTIQSPRQCVFAGTVNENVFLKDPTGGRRYMPVAVDKVNTRELECDRDQIWAEAVQMYKAGEPWHFDPNEPCVKAAQESRFDSDAWEDMVLDYLDEGAMGIPFTRVHLIDLYKFLGIGKEDNNNRYQLTDYHKKRIARIMEHLGWDGPKNIKIDGKQGRGFIKNNVN